MPEESKSLETLISEMQNRQTQAAAITHAETIGDTLPDPDAILTQAAAYGYIKLRPTTLAKYTAVAAEYLGNGFNAASAYQSQYPKAARTTCYTEGYRILRHPQIRAVLAKITQETVKKQEAAEVAAGYVFQEWLNHSNANPVDYLASDSEGNLYVKDLTTLPLEVQRRLRSVDLRRVTTVDKHGNETTDYSVKLKTVDQQQAIAMIAKAQGLLVDRSQVDINFNTAEAIEAGVARQKKLGRLDGHNLYDQDTGQLIDE